MLYILSWLMAFSLLILSCHHIIANHGSQEAFSAEINNFYDDALGRVG